MISSRRIQPGIMVAAVLIVSSLSNQASAATRRSTRGTKATETAEARIQRKLREVLTNQEQILQKFDAVMEELRIVKVRVSR